MPDSVDHQTSNFRSDIPASYAHTKEDRDTDWQIKDAALAQRCRETKDRRAPAYRFRKQKSEQISSKVAQPDANEDARTEELLARVEAA